MPAPPATIRIFHITAIANLQSIAGMKALRAKAQLTMHGAGYSNIAYQGAQGARAVKQVPHSPGGVIHDYVPFYFAPRSPMLLTINRGNVPDCPHRQSDIVHLATTVKSVVDAGMPFVFYNYNATLHFADCFNELSDLDKIDWPLFFEAPTLGGYCKYWNSVHDKPKYMRRMETRQAEFLVHSAVPLGLIDEVGTCNDAATAQVRAIFDQMGIEIPVATKPTWYF